MDPVTERIIDFNGIDRLLFWAKLGGWMANPNWNRITSFLYRCYWGVAVYLLVGVILGDILAVPDLIRSKKYELLFAAVSDIGVIFAVVGQLTMFTIFKRQTFGMNDALKGAEKFAYKYSPQVASEVFPKYARLSNNTSWLTIIFIMFCSTWYVTIPVFTVLRVYPDINYKEQRLIAGSANYGLDKETQFWYIYTIQVLLCAEMMCIVMLGPLLTTPVLYLLIRGQVMILVRSLDIVSEANTQKTSKHSPTGTTSLLSMLYKIDREEEILLSGTSQDIVTLEDCIQHHQMILRCLKLLKFFAGASFFTNVIGTAIFAVNAALAAQQIGSDAWRIAFLAACLESSLLFATWSLMEIRGVVSSVAFAAFSVGHRLPGVDKECWFMMHRANKVEKFPAGVFRSFTFKSLYKILDIAFSYYVLFARN